MVSSVTIVGSNHTPIVLSYDSASNFALAQQIAAQINAQIASGKLVTEFDTNGPPPTTLPKGAAGAYVQTIDPVVILPSNYTTDLVTKSGNALVFGSGAANEEILAGSSTNLTFIATAGSGTVLAGAGGSGSNALYVGGSGNWSLNVGDGTNLIDLTGNGSDTITAGTGHNTMLLGGGQYLITETGDDIVTGGSGAETIDASGAHTSVVFGEASDLLFVGGLGGATIGGGTGSDTYFGYQGGTAAPQLIEGGSGGNNLLIAGSGSTTLIGGGNGDQLYAMGGASQVLIGGSGKETLSAAASYGNVTLVGGSGHDVLMGGIGNDTFVGGSGQTTIQAGFGQNLYEFVNQGAEGSAKDLVTGILDPSAIKIDLVGYGLTEVAYALAHQTVKNGSDTIQLTDGTKITFEDVTSLKQSNFT
jgi:Ca2+-binding RTX toxin-like protein